MSIIACTLYEGHYHYGAAALCNSLYRHGFRGSVYIGYRGTLPFWALKARPNAAVSWPQASIFTVTPDMEIHFLPVTSKQHFALYKPQFMLDVLALNQTAEGITYFDPDIVIKCNWSFFEKWVSSGVAVVHELIHNDMPERHPVRLQWDELISLMGKKRNKALTSYINSGFCGVSRNDAAFLALWKNALDTGYKLFKLDPTRVGQLRDPNHPFFREDQDALNIAAMCCNEPLSEVGPEGMDFIGGGYIMSHAYGGPKPWKKKFIRSALRAKAPSIPEKWYWSNVRHPICLYGKTAFTLTVYKIKIAAFISRFYGR